MNCYYTLNTTEQSLKLKTWELFTNVFRHSSETSQTPVDTWFIDLGLRPAVTE